MVFLGWIGTHWFDLFQTTSILVGLFATVQTIRADTKERKIGNLFTITNAHRDIWSALYSRPELVRVIRSEVDLKKVPLTPQEWLFVHLLVLHLRASFKARQAGMEFSDDAVATDIRWFFSRQIPRVVWERSKHFQDQEFVDYVESCFDEDIPTQQAA